MSSKLNILVAPLDWGLGHATRCIPIIRALVPYAKVTIAGNGNQLALLKQEFPKLDYLPLEGYGITYSGKRRSFALKLVSQLPKLWNSVRREHRWLREINNKYKFDVVISDNRYGLHVKGSYCVFITHQLNIKAPFDWLEKMARKLNYWYVNKFNECWVPDFNGHVSLAGKLSHPQQMPQVPVHYIGVLSRLAPDNSTAHNYDWLFLLSGPEPQRTLFENKILQVHSHLPGTKLLVRGLPGSSDKIDNASNITIVNHLPGQELQEMLLAAAIIVCRAGYTSIMELVSMNKNAVLVATPGQTEQEYLARHLADSHWFGMAEQESDDEDFINQLLAARQLTYTRPQMPATTLPDFVSAFISRIKR